MGSKWQFEERAWALVLPHCRNEVAEFECWANRLGMKRRNTVMESDAMLVASTESHLYRKTEFRLVVSVGDWSMSCSSSSGGNGTDIVVLRPEIRPTVLKIS
jgi:hypothetical protein